VSPLTPTMDDGYILYEFELPQSLPGVVTPEP